MLCPKNQRLPFVWLKCSVKIFKSPLRVIGTEKMEPGNDSFGRVPGYPDTRGTQMPGVPRCPGYPGTQVPKYPAQPYSETNTNNYHTLIFESRPSALVHWNSTSGVVGMWVRIPAWPGRGACVLEQRHLTIIAPSFGWDVKLFGPVCCVMHAKRTLDTYREREGGLPRCFWIRALSTQQGGYVRATNLLYYYYNKMHHVRM